MVKLEIIYSSNKTETYMHGIFFVSFRSRFQDICTGKVSTYGMTLMRDVAICKSEFVNSEKAISKLQDFQWDEVLFEYCCLPEVAADSAMIMNYLL